MSQCPRCQNPYQKGARFCSQCGAPLVSEEVPSGATPPPRLMPSMQPWVLGLLLTAAIIIVVLLGLLFRSTAPPSVPAPAPKAEAPAPPAPAPTPAPPAAAPAATPAPAPAPDLKQQLQSVLAAMRQAHLQKDIDLYLSCYSPTFPDLEKKRLETQAAWNNFDFLNAFFTIDDVKPLDENAVNATVTWSIDTRNRRTQELASSKQAYRVRFVREMGTWRIQALEEVK